VRQRDYEKKGRRGVESENVMASIIQLFLVFVFALMTYPCGNGSGSDKTQSGGPVDNEVSKERKALADDRRVPEGKWGGHHVRLEVSGSGAEIEFDCAHGRLTGPLTLQHGRFAATGTYVRESGPVRQDESERGQRVFFKGEVEGSRMILIFSLTEDFKEAETFTLKHRADARLFKCK
jgi:hypothetical protein